MDELRELFQQMLNQDLIQITLSNTADRERAAKVKVRPVMARGNLVFQETLYRGTKVFHSNYAKEEMQGRLLDYMTDCFRQAQMSSAAEEATVLVSRKGKVTVKRRRRPDAGSRQDAPDLSHNRSKKYVLPEGVPVDFLVELGVQTPEGRVVNAKYDKFRQINRYLEFIRDILDIFPSDRTIRIVDFGCGKSYLTFAMYYYLHRLQGRDIRVTGLDLKADVIRHCSELAEKLHYDGLTFQEGDIQSFRGVEQVDMVVSLHACDKATDYALEKAVKWGASVIMAVPCCQHELNSQIRCDTLQPILKYGVVKERMAALITDALRANLLEEKGYDTQILEFIDMEHTPKNLMIRAVKTAGIRPRGRVCAEEEGAVRRLMEFLRVNPTLKELL
ncbi:MAG: SAM-dependent methyltransferase [Lachnospiraceae bacterium]|nr:SAM-dependent methyltransferase [Lachnospiraceae bacterium]